MKSNNSWLLKQRLLLVGAEDLLQPLGAPKGAAAEGEFVQRHTAQSKTEVAAVNDPTVSPTLRLLTVAKALYCSTVSLLASRRKVHERL